MREARFDGLMFLFTEPYSQLPSIWEVLGVDVARVGGRGHMQGELGRGSSGGGLMRVDR